MLITKSPPAVLLKLNNPARVTQTIPTAKMMTYKGESLVVVPHRIEEVRLLNAMGIRAPSPVRTHYDWPGRHTPFDHQIVTTDFLTLYPRSYCLNDMGTGKTLSVLWAIDYLMRIGEVRKVCIVAPLSTLERVWGDEIFFNFPHLNYQVVHSASRERRLKLLEQETDIYIVNHDGVKVLGDALKARDDIDLFVIDELAAFRNSSTDLFKSLKAILAKKAYVWGLTGSPTPRAPTDAWSQCRLITPTTVPPYFGRFRDLTMRQMGPFSWEPREGASLVVANCMQPSIRFRRDECIDLPPTTVSTRHVEMSPEQKKLYKEMANRLKTEFEGGTINAVNAAVKAMKLLQISCGVVYDNNGEGVVIPAEARMKVVEEIVEEAEGKVIVFVPWTGGLNRVAEDVSRYARVAIVNGQVNKNKRDEIFREFQEGKEIEVLVAHPECMAHGLTLTAASVIVWYSPMNDGEIYEQACARIPRPGQTKHTHIIHLEGSFAERRAYDGLQKKANMQQIALAIIEDGRLD